MSVPIWGGMGFDGVRGGEAVCRCIKDIRAISVQVNVHCTACFFYGYFQIKEIIPNYEYLCLNENRRQ